VFGAVEHAACFTLWPLTGLPVACGVLLGVGARLKGGCTFSTLTHAVAGNIGLADEYVACPAP